MVNLSDSQTGYFYATRNMKHYGRVFKKNIQYPSSLSWEHTLNFMRRLRSVSKLMPCTVMDRSDVCNFSIKNNIKDNSDDYT